jgi:hypothetical protein
LRNLTREGSDRVDCSNGRPFQPFPGLLNRAVLYWPDRLSSYTAGALIAGAQSSQALLIKNRFLPDLDAIPEDSARQAK